MTSGHGLSIGVVAEQAGCTVPTVRYYEEIGLLPRADRRPGGHRTYGSGELGRLTFIRRCRDFGFSVEQIRALLELTVDPSRNCIEARDLAQTHLDEVRAKLAEMKKLEKSLQGFVDSCNTACAGGPATACTIFDDLASSNRGRRTSCGG